jgi:hypothetical protein
MPTGIVNEILLCQYVEQVRRQHFSGAATVPDSSCHPEPQARDLLESKDPMPTLGYGRILRFAPAKMRILNPTGGPEAHDCSREYSAPAKMPLEHGSGGLGEGLEVDVVAEGL